MKKSLKESDEFSTKLIQDKIEAYEKEKQFIIDHPKSIMTNKRKSRGDEEEDEVEPNLKRFSSFSSNDSDYIDSGSDDDRQYSDQDVEELNSLKKMSISNILNDE
jgi:ribose 1,5-bisphosphokinase PhnN